MINIWKTTSQNWLLFLRPLGSLPRLIKVTGLVYSFLFFLPPVAFAQNAEAQSLLAQADSLMQNQQDSIAYPLLLQADSLLAIKPDKASLLLKDKLLGDYYFGARDYEKSRQAYESARKYVEIELTQDLGVKAARAVNDLGIVYFRLGKMDLAKTAHHQSIKLYKKYQDTLGLTYNYGNLAIIAREQKQLDSAIYYSEQTNLVSRQINDTIGIGISHIRLARIYGDNQQEIKALDHYNKAVDIFSNPDHARYANAAKRSLSVLYKRLGDIESGKKILNELLSYYESNQNIQSIGRYYIAYAELFLSTQQLDSADYFLDKAFKVLEQANAQKNVAQAYHIKGNLARQRGKHTASINYYKKSLAIAEGKYKGQAAAAMLSLAQTYNELGQHQQVLDWVNRALESYENHISDFGLINSYRLRYLAYKALGQIKQAFEFQELYIKHKESYTSNDKNLDIARIEYRNQLEREKAIQEKKDLAYQQELNQQRWILYGSILVTALLGVIAFISYRSFKSKQQANIELAKNAEELKQMNEELMHMNEEQNQLNEHIETARRNEQVLAEQLQTAYEQLQELDHSKTRFFANISHELRTPLTVILGNLDRLKKQDSKTSQEQVLAAAERNAKQLQQLVNQLLDITKLEDGKMKLNLQEEDIIQLLKGHLFAFHSLAEQKGIQLNFQSNVATTQAYIDRSVMEKIAYNLISNAIKFTPKDGQIFMDITVEDHQTTLVVKDTGIGIPQDKLPHIFDRFYQVESSMQRSYEGTGIGLALVKELVELHKGIIQVESTEGEGTTFRIIIASNKVVFTAKEFVEEEPDLHQTQITIPILDMNLNDEHKKQAILNQSKPIVLLVEDHPDLQELIKQHLADTYQIIQAYDGEAGAKMAFEHIPDLIISDVMMPKKNGFELCEQLKKDQRTSHIPVVMLTARVEQADKLQGLEIGADDYLAKPFDPDELRIRVQNLIQTRRKLRAQFAEKTEFVIYNPKEIEKNTTDNTFMDQLLDTLEQNYTNEHYSVDDLAEAIALNKRQLNRKLKAMIDSSASKIIQNFRLQKSIDLLHDTTLKKGDIAFMVGFASVTYFNKCFKDKFGKTPNEYQLDLLDSNS